FCATVEAGDVSEEDMARTTSDRLGSDIHVGSLTQRSYYPMLLRSIVDFTQPIAHPNLARFYVNAATTTGAGRPEQILGVASDLLFGGQSNIRSFHKYQVLSGRLSFIPDNARRILAMAMGRPEETDLSLRLRNPLHALAEAGMGNLERASMRQRIAAAVSGIEDARERATKMLMIENLCDYQQHLLNRRYELAARSGMSLLFPFLDTEIVNFAMNLPVKHCVDWSGSKKVVREAARPYLGRDLSKRAKWGGDIPTGRWIAPLRPLLENGFLVDQMRLETAVLGPLLDSNTKLLWNMLDLEIWGRLCLFGEDPEKLLDAIRKNGLESDTFESVRR
ncbi:MAG TPA: asparagine synthase C-terminal domain-containing protein, partial [Candidatus Krumholzibacterium sp.]|nr:asparagine synthase C-terminal domain-containing protein [Candidatus Krumholzibacterium sp.]